MTLQSTAAVAVIQEETDDDGDGGDTVEGTVEEEEELPLDVEAEQAAESTVDRTLLVGLKTHPQRTRRQQLVSSCFYAQTYG